MSGGWGVCSVTASLRRAGFVDHSRNCGSKYYGIIFAVLLFATSQAMLLAAVPRCLCRVKRRLFSTDRHPKRSTKYFDEHGRPRPRVRDLFDAAAKKLGVTELDEWYDVKVDRWDALGHSVLLRKQFNGSLSGALKQVYPEHSWNAIRFKMKSKGLFASHENQRAYFEWLGAELGVRVLADWYDFLPPADKLKHLGGSSILRRHDGSGAAALQFAYPEHVFEPWKFTKISARAWKNQRVLRAFFDSLGKQLGVTQLRDWYNLADTHVIRHAGGWRAIFQGDTLARVLNLAYPEHEFHDWLFSSAPSGFWTAAENRRRVLLWIAREKGLLSREGMSSAERKEEEQAAAGPLPVADLETLYHIQVADLNLFGGTKPRNTCLTSPPKLTLLCRCVVSRLLGRYRDMAELLENTFPEHSWVSMKFSHLREKE